ncbi:MAG: NAD(P)H-binding protein [Bacilli bacterium]
MNVLILGATGTFGKELINKLLRDTEYKLTLVSRNAKEIYKDNDRIKVFNIDATKKKELEQVLDNQDIVYCTISGDDLPIVAENLVQCEDKIKRLLFMGAVGIYNEIPKDMDDEDNVDNNPDQVPNRKAADILENSKIKYTIFRPGYLRDGKEDDYVITRKNENAKGYITTIPSVIKIALEIMNNEDLYSYENISITKNIKQ